MVLALLLVIYLVFISLGLPDTVLGSSFPAISGALGLDSDIAGYIGMVVSAFTILSSLLSSFILRKVKTGPYVFVSILLTALGLILFSFVPPAYASWAFYLIAILLGLGAGGIDAALNNYVALHYKAVHMNWLHCSWAIGAFTGPLLLGTFINGETNEGWDNGVRLIAYIQLGIALLVFLTLPLWNKAALKEQAKKEDKVEKEVVTPKGTHKKLLIMPLFILGAIGFFCYCGLETTTGFWAPSFFHYAKECDASLSATLGSCFYIGIALGRFISGVLSYRISPKNLIRIGESLIFIGAIMALVPNVSFYVSAAGICLIGLGCAPIYPCIILLTPYRYSKTLSQVAMSLQMAVAYLGNLFVSPLFGLIASSFGDAYFLLPYIPFAFVLLMSLVHEIGNYLTKRRDSSLSKEEKEEYFTEAVHE